MTESKFKLQQVGTFPDYCTGLSFAEFMKTERSPLEDPVITPLIGDYLDYGSLFAYCFRRFGYPERGWDGRKDLVQYFLTTPHPELFLGVRPYVGGTPTISLSFYATAHQLHAIRNYACKPQQEWLSRAYAHAENCGLPQWMPQWLAMYEKVLLPQYSHLHSAKHWHETFTAFPLLKVGAFHDELANTAAEFHEALLKSYQAIEEYPGLYLRPRELQEFKDDDPLKPLLGAAVTALEDLRTPVLVNDVAIDAFGEADDDEEALKPVHSAGYPSGYFGNQASEVFAQVHQAIFSLGEGDPLIGMKKLLILVGAHQVTA